MRRRAYVIVILLVAAGGSACSSSAKTAASSPSTTQPTGTSAYRPTATTSTTATTTTPTTSGSFTGSSTSAFCDLARRDLVPLGTRNIANETPPVVKQQFAGLPAAMSQLRAAAPGAIKADVATFVTNYDKYLQALAAGGYNLENVDPNVDQALSSPAMKAASARIAQYGRQVCGIAPPTT